MTSIGCAIASSSACPTSEYITPQAMQAVSGMLVVDSRGNRIPFGSIYEFQRTIVVFIRHFFCKMCHNYVSNLARVSPDALDAAGTKIVLIGCGAWDLIPSYQGTTGFRSLMYSDPTGKLHDALGLHRLKSSGSSSSAGGVSQDSGASGKPRLGLFESLKRPLDTLRGRNGSTSQLGADLVLGPGDVCVYAHRMRSAADHVDIPDLLALADVRPTQLTPTPTSISPSRNITPAAYVRTQKSPSPTSASPPPTIPSPTSTNGTRGRRRASTTTGNPGPTLARSAAALPPLHIPESSAPTPPEKDRGKKYRASVRPSTSGSQASGFFNAQQTNTSSPNISMSPTSHNLYQPASPMSGVQPASSFSSVSSSSYSSHRSPHPFSAASSSNSQSVYPSRATISRRPSDTTTYTATSLSPTPPLTPTTPENHTSSNSFASYQILPGAMQQMSNPKHHIIPPSLRDGTGNGSTRSTSTRIGRRMTTGGAMYFAHGQVVNVGKTLEEIETYMGSGDGIGGVPLSAGSGSGRERYRA